MNEEIERFKEAPIGMRNHALYAAAYALARAFDHELAELHNAAVCAGLRQPEIDRTINSAVEMARGCA